MSKEFLHQEFEVAQAGADIKEGSRWGRVGKVFTSIFFSFSIFLTIGAVIFTVIFFISIVEGSSMMVTLNADYIYPGVLPENNIKDSVLVNRTLKPNYADIIVVKHIWGEEGKHCNPKKEPGKEEFFIKRVIGLEGDKISFNRYGAGTSGNPYTYKTVRNGEEIDEWYLVDEKFGLMFDYGQHIYEYLNGGTPTSQLFVPFGDCITENPETGVREIVVPAGHIFFMGDNRGGKDWYSLSSYDCTAFGPQAITLVEGVVVDRIDHLETIPQYAWRKFLEFFSFKWLFG